MAKYTSYDPAGPSAAPSSSTTGAPSEPPAHMVSAPSAPSGNGGDNGGDGAGKRAPTKKAPTKGFTKEERKWIEAHGGKVGAVSEKEATEMEARLIEAKREGATPEQIAAGAKVRKELEFLREAEREGATKEQIEAGKKALAEMERQREAEAVPKLSPTERFKAPPAVEFRIRRAGNRAVERARKIWGDNKAKLEAARRHGETIQKRREGLIPMLPLTKVQAASEAAAKAKVEAAAKATKKVAAEASYQKALGVAREAKEAERVRIVEKAKAEAVEAKAKSETETASLAAEKAATAAEAREAARAKVVAQASYAKALEVARKARAAARTKTVERAKAEAAAVRAKAEATAAALGEAPIVLPTEAVLELATPEQVAAGEEVRREIEILRIAEPTLVPEIKEPALPPDVKPDKPGGQTATVGGKEVYVPGSTMHDMGFRTPEEYATAQKAGVSYGPHEGEEVPEGSVIVEARVAGEDAVIRYSPQDSSLPAESKIRKGEYFVPATTTEGKTVMLTAAQAKTLSIVEGKDLFGHKVRLGLIPEGSMYIDEKSYLPASTVSEIEKTSPELHKILITEGYGAYERAATAARETAAKAREDYLTWLVEQAPIEEAKALVREAYLKQLVEKGPILEVKALIAASNKQILGELREAGYEVGTLKPGEFGPEMPIPQYRMVDALRGGFDEGKLRQVFGKDAVDSAKQTISDLTLLEPYDSVELAIASLDKDVIDAAKRLYPEGYEQLEWKPGEVPKPWIYKGRTITEEERQKVLKDYEELPHIEKIGKAHPQDLMSSSQERAVSLAIKTTYLPVRASEAVTEAIEGMDPEHREILDNFLHGPPELREARFENTPWVLLPGKTPEKAIALGKDKIASATEAVDKWSKEEGGWKFGKDIARGVADIVLAMGAQIPLSLANIAVTGDSSRALAEAAELGVGLLTWPAHLPIEVAKGHPGYVAGTAITLFAGPMVVKGVLSKAKSRISPRELSNDTLAFQADVARIPAEGKLSPLRTRALVDAIEMIELGHEKTVTVYREGRYAGEVARAGHDVIIKDIEGKVVGHVSPMQRYVPDTLYHVGDNPAAFNKPGGFTVERGPTTNVLWLSQQPAFTFGEKVVVAVRTGPGDVKILPKYIEAIRDLHQRRAAVEAAAKAGELEPGIYRVFKAYGEPAIVEFEWMMVPETKGLSVKSTWHAPGKNTATSATIHPITGESIPVKWFATENAAKMGRGAPTLTTKYKAEAFAQVVQPFRELVHLRPREVKVTFGEEVGALSPLASKFRAVEKQVVAAKMKKFAKEETNVPPSTEYFTMVEREKAGSRVTLGVKDVKAETVRKLNLLDVENMPRGAAEPVLEYIKGRDAVLYGSTVEWVHVPKAFKPKDIDIAIRNPLDAAKNLAEIIRKHSEVEVRVTESPRQFGKGAVIELLDKGEWKTVADVRDLATHMKWADKYGLKPETTIVEGIKMETLGTQTAARSTAIMRSGIIDEAPYIKRMKDIPRFQKAVEYLVERSDVTAAEKVKLLRDLKEYLGDYALRRAEALASDVHGRLQRPLPKEDILTAKGVPEAQLQGIRRTAHERAMERYKKGEKYAEAYAEEFGKLAEKPLVIHLSRVLFPERTTDMSGEEVFEIFKDYTPIRDAFGEIVEPPTDKLLLPLVTESEVPKEFIEKTIEEIMETEVAVEEVPEKVPEEVLDLEEVLEIPTEPIIPLPEPIPEKPPEVIEPEMPVEPPEEEPPVTPPEAPVEPEEPIVEVPEEPIELPVEELPEPVEEPVSEKPPEVIEPIIEEPEPVEEEPIKPELIEEVPPIEEEPIVKEPVPEVLEPIGLEEALEIPEEPIVPLEPERPVEPEEPVVVEEPYEPYEPYKPVVPYIPPPPVIVQIRGPEGEEAKEVEIPPGSIAWRMGALKGGDVIKYIPPPYTQPKPITLIGRRPAGWIDKGKTPQETIQIIGYAEEIPKRISIDLGWTDIQVVDGRVIEFTGAEGLETDVGTRVPAKTMGMSIPMGISGLRFGTTFEEALEYVPRDEAQKGFIEEQIQQMISQMSVEEFVRRVRALELPEKRIEELLRYMPDRERNQASIMFAEEELYTPVGASGTEFAKLRPEYIYGKRAQTAAESLTAKQVRTKQEEALKRRPNHNAKEDIAKRRQKASTRAKEVIRLRDIL